MNARAALSEEVARDSAPIAPGPVTDSVVAAPGGPEPSGPPTVRESGAAPRRRRLETLRTIQYLMVFRVAMATLLLGTVVVTALGNGGVDSLSGPFARFGFAMLFATYLASVGYGLAFRRVKNLIRFAYLQITRRPGAGDAADPRDRRRSEPVLLSLLPRRGRGGAARAASRRRGRGRREHRRS